MNLELPLRAGDPLGGHIVQGHVDGTGASAGIDDEGFARVVRIGAGEDVLRYVVEKGSVAVDGVSLTVAEVDDGLLHRLAHPRDAGAHDVRGSLAGRAP